MQVDNERKKPPIGGFCLLSEVMVLKLVKNFLETLRANFSGTASALHVDIRMAEPGDARFIFELSMQQVLKRHLNTDYLHPAAQRRFMLQIKAAISGSPVLMPGQRDGAKARVKVLTMNSEPIGFSWTMEERRGSWDADVELHLVALEEEFHGRGLGRLLVEKTLADVKSKRVYARCKPASSRMLALLKARGFAERGPRTPSGTVTVEQRR
jgi:RimJ/RimL family protein N-acetyltransferase